VKPTKKWAVPKSLTESVAADCPDVLTAREAGGQGNVSVREEVLTLEDVRRKPADLDDNPRQACKATSLLSCPPHWDAKLSNRILPEFSLR
jgi:hypothetical protein